METLSLCQRFRGASKLGEAGEHPAGETYPVIGGPAWAEQSGLRPPATDGAAAPFWEKADSTPGWLIPFGLQWCRGNAPREAPCPWRPSKGTRLGPRPSLPQGKDPSSGHPVPRPPLSALKAKTSEMASRCVFRWCRPWVWLARHRGPWEEPLCRPLGPSGFSQAVGPVQVQV